MTSESCDLAIPQLINLVLHVSDRFTRPSFAARSRPTQSTSAPVSEKESVVSEKAKVATATAARGRSHYQS